MKTLKKVGIIITLLFAVMFSGCAKNTSSYDILTSFYPIYIITSEIADGTGLTIENMARPQTGCLHDYQLTTRDMRLMDKADIFIINGGGMENTFLERAYENKGIYIIDSSEGIDMESHEHEHHEHEHGHHEGHNHEENAHFWMSAEFSCIQAENICKQLSEKYPEYKDIFEKNLEGFKEKAESLICESTEEANVIIFNEAFEFILEENGCEVVESIEIDENQVPSAKEMARICDEAKELKIKAIFAADDNGLTFAKTLSREIGAPIYVLDPMTYGTSMNKSYYELMKENTETIKEAIR